MQVTCKSPNKEIWVIKKTTEIPLTSFILATHCLFWGLFLSVVYLPSELHRGKFIVTACSCHLEIASWLRIEALVHISLSRPGSLRLEPMQAYVARVSVDSYAYQSCCDWNNPVFLWCYPSPFPLLYRSMSPEGEGFHEDVPFITECSKVSSFQCVVQLWVSVLAPIYCRRNLLWWGWVRHLPMDAEGCH